jgi:hypothetical protein
MAEKRKYNSKINAKGLEKSVSEEQARHMASHQGHTYTFLVQAHAGPKTVEEDGSEIVSLIPDLVEMVPAEHEDRIHAFQRALYLARPEQFGQQAFEAASSGEQTIDQAAAGVDAIVERDKDGEPVGVWDGNPDGPLDPPADDAGDEPGGCDYPGCSLDSEHDGDHDVPGDEPEAGGTVAQFSSKARRG